MDLWKMWKNNKTHFVIILPYFTIYLSAIYQNGIYFKILFFYIFNVTLSDFHRRCSVSVSIFEHISEKSQWADLILTVIYTVVSFMYYLEYCLFCHILGFGVIIFYLCVFSTNILFNVTYFLTIFLQFLNVYFQIFFSWTWTIRGRNIYFKLKKKGSIKNLHPYCFYMQGEEVYFNFNS